MLVELAIENLGVIERVNLSFGNGFTALTGETGAGKTMLVEAINLIVGARADANVVRSGADEARVEARFVRQVDGAEIETILTRVVAKEGRSRAYVDGRMATVTQLSEIGEELVDIHGQHAHQRLLGAAAQRDALDRFAGVDLTALRKAREAVTQIDASLAALGGDEKTRAREIDLLQFQVGEILGAAIGSPDEETDLGREEDLLADATRYRETLWAVAEFLGGDNGAGDAVGRAARAVAPFDGLGGIRDRLASLTAEIDDLLAEVRTAAERSEEQPERLEAVRQRRQMLRDLMRKYGDSLADVISFGQEASGRLDELTSYSERVESLNAERGKALAVLRAEQVKVGTLRRARAAALGAAVQKHLRSLALPHAEVLVSVGDENSDPAGDAVTFLLAANPGSEPLPLTKVASGGELARTMLAIRLVLTDEPGTMVFDEVDAGIGGAAAVAVATALRELGRDHQVFAVTHLPQVAASAHHHVMVSKTVVKGKTFGSAVPLGDEEREAEVARMLSGGVADGSALTHAQDLIASLSGAAQKRKR
ncbi:MAG: DNA repair protein RecN [Actinobacteria bacterium]|nr:DNA repair protein RecN [Actinomycetota bacterium]